jgi:hypothetical protein
MPFDQNSIIDERHAVFTPRLPELARIHRPEINLAVWTRPRRTGFSPVYRFLAETWHGELKVQGTPSEAVHHALQALPRASLGTDRGTADPTPAADHRRSSGAIGEMENPI